MTIEVAQVAFSEIEQLRELYRHEAHCQIVYDSILTRGLADAYVITVDDRTAGYGGVWRNTATLMEFFVLPHYRRHASSLARELLITTRATHIEAQTNMPGMLTLLYDHAIDIHDEKVLFSDQRPTAITCVNGTFRRLGAADQQSVFPHKTEPVGDWGIQAEGRIVATGGLMLHYNPPYSDIYMEVDERERRRGFGSYLVQELKRVSYETGRVPAARCEGDNVPSRRTLEKAGLLACARMLKGAVRDGG